MNGVYRLVYTSRSLVGGDPDQRRCEIDRILDACRRHNRRDGITGALLLGTGTFAQILEGARHAVEATFERIQCDPRHGDIDVLQCEAVAERMFPNWDMALVGRAERGRLLWKDLSRDAEVDLSRLDGDALCSAVLAMMQAEEHGPRPDPRELGAEIEARRRLVAAAQPAAGRAAPAPAPTPASRSAPPAGPVAGPPAAPVAASLQPADAGDAVLRAALDEERGRTTILRRELDAARVALARAASDAEAIGRHRDIWADRSVQLRSSLAEARGDLAAAAGERDDLRGRLAARDADVGRLRAERDVWADCARALAAVLGVQPAEDGARDQAGSPERDRPPLRKVSG